MSANDEFPRGWTLSTVLVGAGLTPVITVPAVPGVAHVLTHIGSLLNIGAAGPAFGALVEDGTVTERFFRLFCPGPSTSDSQSWDGQVAGLPGNALTITWDAPVPAASAGFILIEGHDI